MIRSGIWALFLVVFGCSAPSPLPGMQPGEIGRVTKIIDGDGLILDTGQNVRLISIQAPVLAPRDRDPEPYAGESARVLEDMALGRKVQLFYPGMTRDRYDRALAHVVTIDAAGPRVWLNQAMVEKGAARVRLYGSTSARGLDLLQSETDARNAAIGLWKRADYAVRGAAEFDGSERGYFLVQGELAPSIKIDFIEDADRRYAPACYRMFKDAPLILKIDTDARSACGVSSGSMVQVRGWVSDGMLGLRHPWHLQSATVD